MAACASPTPPPVRSHARCSGAACCGASLGARQEPESRSAETTAGFASWRHRQAAWSWKLTMFVRFAPCLGALLAPASLHAAGTHSGYSMRSPEGSTLRCRTGRSCGRSPGAPTRKGSRQGARTKGSACLAPWTVISNSRCSTLVWCTLFVGGHAACCWRRVRATGWCESSMSSVARSSRRSTTRADLCVPWRGVLRRRCSRRGPEVITWCRRHGSSTLPPALPNWR
mmetsp:Transcript_100593/g.283723  ORF Transcript_100593/g.283723 Transcript_100593/m.283723 type:complete len:227 (+) Transcript_100593:116-796(+)